MKRRISFLLCLLLACTLRAQDAVAPASDTSGYAPDIAAILKKGTLVIAMVNRDEPPYFAKNAAGEMTGGEAEFARTIAKQLGVKPVFDLTAETYDAVADEVASHRADIGLGMLSITSHRALKVSFTEPYLKFHPSLLVNRFAMAQLGWQKDVLGGLSNAGPSVKIGVLSGSSGIDEVKDDFPGVTIVEYKSWDAIVKDVACGSLFAGASSPAMVQEWMRKQPELSLLAVEVADTRHTEMIGIAVGWQNPNFRYWLTLYIRELLNDGTIDAWVSEHTTKQ